MAVSTFKAVSGDDDIIPATGHAEWSFEIGIDGPEVQVGGPIFHGRFITLEAHNERGYTYVTLDLDTAADLAADIIDRIHATRRSARHP
jgi:hypothetical protein